ncbi:MAG: hypothetical protein QM784_27945 [Polyangiaceae bacterium]
MPGAAGAVAGGDVGVAGLVGEVAAGDEVLNPVDLGEGAERGQPAGEGEAPPIAPGASLSAVMVPPAIFGPVIEASASWVSSPRHR